jgi:hypothetical protein
MYTDRRIGSNQHQIRTNKILVRANGREFLSATWSARNAVIIISCAILYPATNSVPLSFMLRWRATMRELSAEARLHLYARSLSGRTTRGLHTAALYGAFVVIAAVVFGTLSHHPF